LDLLYCLTPPFLSLPTTVVDLAMVIVSSTIQAKSTNQPARATGCSELASYMNVRKLVETTDQTRIRCSDRLYMWLASQSFHTYSTLVSE
jgi:hypothetical protein